MYYRNLANERGSLEAHWGENRLFETCYRKKLGIHIGKKKIGSLQHAIYKTKFWVDKMFFFGKEKKLRRMYRSYLYKNIYFSNNSQKKHIIRKSGKPNI